MEADSTTLEDLRNEEAEALELEILGFPSVSSVVSIGILVVLSLLLYVIF